MRTSVLKNVALGVAAAAAVAVGATPAHAASGDAGYILAGSNIRRGPSTYYAVRYTTAYNAWIPLDCWVSTQYVNGSAKWFKLSSVNDWVHSSNVPHQPSLPKCPGW